MHKSNIELHYLALLSRINDWNLEVTKQTLQMVEDIGNDEGLPNLEKARRLGIIEGRRDMHRQLQDLLTEALEEWTHASE